MSDAFIRPLAGSVDAVNPRSSSTPSGAASQSAAGRFLIVMLAFGGLSFVAGILFVLHGAWPVTGFFGLDVGLVYLAFRINYRSARREERIRLVADALTVERRGVRGERCPGASSPIGCASLSRRVMTRATG